MKTVRAQLFLLALGSLFTVGGPSSMCGREDPAHAAATTPEPTTPQIEVGAHTGDITSLATDAAGRLLVTGSRDATIRTWDLKSGALVATLRTESDGGAVDAVAISPDGAHVAAAIRTAEAAGIWMFEGQRGLLLSRGYRDNPRLSFSPDGKRLLQDEGDQYDTVTGRHSEGERWAGSRVSLDVDRTGRVVAGEEWESYPDGVARVFVKLFDSAGQLQTRVQPAGRSSVVRVCFSPDGKAVALAYHVDPQIEVLSGADLKPLLRPTLTGVGPGNAAAFAWSVDGATLFAAGTFRVGDRFAVRRWPSGGRGKPQDFPAAASPIVELLALPSGGVAFAAGAEWGVLSPSGERILGSRPPVLDLHADPSSLLVDAGGGRVRFRDATGKAMTFSVAEGTLAIDAPPHPSLRAPLTTLPDLQILAPSSVEKVGVNYFPREPAGPDAQGVAPWRDAERLFLSSNPREAADLLIEPPARWPVESDTIRSLAVAPDGHSLLVGSDGHLRVIAGRYTEWNLALTRPAWTANVSGDGRLVVAAIGDGTVRWYRYSDGKALLALFVDPDRKRWVAWTPSGYYDAAPGGEAFLGWRVDHGGTRGAELRTDEETRKRFHRPEVIRKILASADEAVALAADEPRQSPALRPDPGTHTAAILSMAADPSGRYLFTAAEDDTARVWDLTLGRAAAGPAAAVAVGADQSALVDTLRLPGGVSSGVAPAVAIARDGKLLAVAGSDGRDEGKTNLFVLDRARRAVRRIEAGGDAVAQLLFSADGTHLAAVMKRKEKHELKWSWLRVFRVADGLEEAIPSECAARVSAVDTDGAGRWAMLTPDNDLVKLCSSSFRQLQKLEEYGAYSIHFSPDGKRIALGYPSFEHGPIAPKVISAEDLSLLYRPSIAGVDNGDLSLVAWSAGGSALCAGGAFRVDGVHPIRCWSDGGRGSFRDAPSTRAELQSLVALADGSIAFGADDGAWGVLAEGKTRELHAGGALDLRTYPQQKEPGDSALRVDASGGRVRFPDGRGGRLVFSLPDRALGPESSAGGGFRDPGSSDDDRRSVDEAAGDLTWISAAIAGDHQSFLFGTDCCLESRTPGGDQRWGWYMAATPRSVALSADGRLAVAALGDGTLRWFRNSDGEELLALFLHADRSRWIAWTPSGYYDASVGGEDLAGWLVDQGRRELAAFFPLSRFRARFYRPDVVARMLDAADEDRALALANAAAKRQDAAPMRRAELPPLVTILAPGDGDSIAARQATVRVELRSQSGEAITGVRALVDGRPAEMASPRRERGDLEADVRAFTLALPARDSTLTVLARTAVSSEASSSVRLRWAGGLTEAEAAKPRLYLLAVGVSDYRNSALRLRYPAKDARDMATALKAQEGGLYSKVELEVLTDGDATRDRVLAGFDWLQRKVTPRDVAILFLSGHGMNSSSDGQYQFLPSDADPESISKTMVPGSAVRDALGRLSGRALLFLDTCQSGNVLEHPFHDPKGFINELSSVENGVMVFAASTGAQGALEDRAWNNGAFTKALVEGLGGEADVRKTGQVTVFMLPPHLSARVQAITDGRQTPTVAIPNMVPDFPVALPGAHGPLPDLPTGARHGGCAGPFHSAH